MSSELSKLEKIWFSIELLKKLIKIFPDKVILYKTIGLMFENSGNLKVSLKFYLVFLHIDSLDLDLSIRYTILIFWQNKKYFLNYILLKSLIKYNLFHIEIISFTAKILEQNNYFKQAAQFWKNFLQKNLLVLKKIPNSNLFLYSFVLWIRAFKKISNSNFHNPDSLKLIHFYSKSLKINLKINCIILQLLIYSALKINLFISFKKNAFILCNALSFQKQPFFINIIKTASLIYRLNLNIITFDSFVNIFNIYNKWLKFFGVHLLEKTGFSRVLHQEKFLYNFFFESKESYNIFTRIPKRGIIVYTKLAEIKKVNGFLPKSLNMYKILTVNSSENLEAIVIIKKICKKFSKKKKKLRIFEKYLRKKIKKILNFNKKKNLEIISLKNLMNTTEEFFQEKKIIGLCRLSLLILSIIFQKSILFFNYNHFFEKKSIKPNFKNLKSKFLSQKKFNSQEFVNIQVENHNYKRKYFFFEELIETVFILINNNEFIFSDKKINFFVLNRLSFRKVGTKLKFILLSLAFKKKKYKKAYEYARFLCLKNPNYLIPWYLLSKIEKQVGFAASKTLRFTLRLLKKYPNSIPAIIFAANHCSIFGSHGYALAEYFQAYRWKKTSSFLNFSIFLQYLHKSFNRGNQNLEYTIILSLCFFFKYKNIRTFTSETFLKRSNKSVLLKMEIFFNKAKLYLFLELKYLALVTFMRVLTQKNQILTICKRNRRFYLGQVDNLKNDALLNIQLLYLNTGNRILADEIKKKIYF
nr:TATA binding protein of transcription factor IIIC [Cryptomonas curvata]